jgi:hypothetical protein
MTLIFVFNLLFRQLYCLQIVGFFNRYNKLGLLIDVGSWLFLRKLLILNSKTWFGVLCHWVQKGKQISHRCFPEDKSG